MPNSLLTFSSRFLKLAGSMPGQIVEARPAR
jgi:hypothetical protein